MKTTIIMLGKKAMPDWGYKHPCCEVDIELELKKEKKSNGKEYDVFSCCGNIWRPSKKDIIYGGQCIDEILQMFPENKLMKEIHRLWTLWHLNDLKADCKHQRELWKGQFDKSGLLGKPCPVCGYKYGHDWIIDEITPDDLALIKYIIENKKLPE